MFGLLMGTLQKFKQESNVSTEKVSKSVDYISELLRWLPLYIIVLHLCFVKPFVIYYLYIEDICDFKFSLQ